MKERRRLGIKKGWSSIQNRKVRRPHLLLTGPVL